MADTYLILSKFLIFHVARLTSAISMHLISYRVVSALILTLKVQISQGMGNGTKQLYGGSKIDIVKHIIN